MDSIHPLKAYRESHDPPLTQEQLADKLGVSAVSVCRWETGARKPDGELVPVISRATGIPPGKLRPDLAFMFAASARRRRAKSAA